MKKALFAFFLLLLVALAATAWAAYSFYTASGRSPGELIRYGEQRLEGHTRVEREAMPVLHWMLAQLGEPTRAELAAPMQVPPLSPNPMRARAAGDGARAGEPAGRGGRILRVGPTRAITTINQASKQARDGDTIEIDAGDYRGDVAVWDLAEVTIRGVGDTVRLIAAGASAEGKALWVIRRGRVRVENIHFIGARVRDRNGAGIRFESGQLTVSHCVFHDNQDGLLTASDPGAELEIRDSEFGYNGGGDGQTHNLYVNHIRSLKVTGSYFHHANGGHLLKSRAANNFIAYNRLSDETGGRASYELEFPNGGKALVLGNIIHQTRGTTNAVMLSFGAEGYADGESALTLVHNTLVNDLRAGGTFVRVAPGAGKVTSVNNLFAGPGAFDPPDIRDATGDAVTTLAALVRPDQGDYRLDAAGRKFTAAAVSGDSGGTLKPDREYVHPAQTRRLAGDAAFVGAIQSKAP